MSEPIMWIDDWIEELPTERRLICVQRAAVAIGFPITLNPDRTIVIDCDEDDHERLEEALGEEFKRMHANDLFEELVEDGLIEADGVDENGEIAYVVR